MRPPDGHAKFIYHEHLWWNRKRRQVFVEYATGKEDAKELRIFRAVYTADLLRQFRIKYTMSENENTAYIDYQSASTVSTAILTRRSLRAFLPTAVSDETVRRILNIAARAPSGTNMQPWKTYVVTGSARQRLCEAACRDFDDSSVKGESQISYYPERWFEPYLSRRRDVGWKLYGLLGIEKGQREKTHAQHRRNYQFFDAPVGLIFTIHKDLATGSWLDYGMFLQNIMILAREQGLHTCPQAAWADYHKTVRRCLPLSEDEVVVSGMAMGFADPEAIENSLVTSRVSDQENIQFLG